jgi:predicted enzyme related to lactoylglutathione lyase
VKAKRLNAVLMDSSNPEALVRFYRERLGIPLEEERHGSELHWACFLDGVHFAIHQKEGLKGMPRNAAVSFEVDDVDGAVSELRQVGTPVELEPCTRPFGRLAAVRDPDGNIVYLHRYPTTH